MTELRRVINKTRNTVLAEKAELANTSLKRIKGLLGRTGLSQGQGMIISPCNSIHTFFMKFAIDVIFLDRQMKVVGLAHSLPKDKLFGAPLRGRQVIELPPGTLKNTGTVINDEIGIE